MRAAYVLRLMPWPTWNMPSTVTAKGSRTHHSARRVAGRELSPTYVTGVPVACVPAWSTYGFPQPQVHTIAAVMVWHLVVPARKQRRTLPGVARRLRSASSAANWQALSHLAK